MFPSLVLAQSAQATQTNFLDRVDPGLLSVAMLVAVIGTFILAVVIVGCVATTIQRAIAIRESNKLIVDLLNRGYSADEIERVVYGNIKFSRKVGKFFRNARNAFRQEERSPVPPTKHTQQSA
ncbi:hypothetical protein [Mariniblastus fucicola]|uniref:Uncharacterized protein n=1 Tax=Mariniblastus fucicola TaxID=980251 RepID=A0A5B9PEB0_9BACT|nr:hypothetical protein [Mariniblastus fucicola]QEG24748.1 hypothetical protein MFFC18_46700 [Mariniblastus fucicola]